MEPGTGREPERVPSGLYHAMLCPLVPYGIRGVIWYQGEGNSGRAWQYRKLLPAMIGGWRKAWGQGDFPFLIVQLPFYRQRLANPGEGEWAELREAQLMTLRQVPNTGLAVTIDTRRGRRPAPAQQAPRRRAPGPLGAGRCLRPRRAYYGAPLYDSAAFEGPRARIRFRHRRAACEPLDGGALRGFAIAGEDRKFVWAEAADRWRYGRGLEPAGSQTRGGPLRLGGQPRLQPGQRRRPARLALPHGRLARPDVRQALRK